MTQATESSSALAPPGEPLLEVNQVTRWFTSTLALDAVDFTLYGGEVVGLVGQNGAGKSTLIRIIAGADPAGGYDGELRVAGERYRPRGVADATSWGITMMPQEVNVVPDLTVAQNLMLGAEPRKFGLIDDQQLVARAQQILDEHQIEIDVTLEMHRVDLARQQLIMIAKALSRKAKVLILDEPTTSLTEAETAHLFDYLRELKSRGVATVFVSHRLQEIFAIADRIVVMRDGKVRGNHLPDDVSIRTIVSEIVGKELEERDHTVSVAGGDDDAGTGNGLRVTSLRVEDREERSRVLVDDLDLEVAPGEVVGLFGLVGSGCSEAAAAIVGVWEGRTEGEIYVGRELRSIGAPIDAIDAGIGYVAPDRRRALALNLSVASNIALASLGRISRWGFVSQLQLELQARDFVERLAVKTASYDVPVGFLSGGNQQKVQVARALASDVDILVLDHPTRGVDVGGRAEIYDVIRQLAGDGRALLLASTEADELLSVCDRIVVLRHGRIVGTFQSGETQEGDLVHVAASEEQTN